MTRRQQRPRSLSQAHRRAVVEIDAAHVGDIEPVRFHPEEQGIFEGQELAGADHPRQAVRFVDRVPGLGQRVGPVKADANAGAPITDLGRRAVKVVEREVVWPGVIGGPRRVAALEEEIAGPVVPHHEDDVAPGRRRHVHLGQLAEVHAAHRVRRDVELYAHRPVAFAQLTVADRRVVALSPGIHGRLVDEARAVTTVETEAVEFDDERSRTADADLDRLSRAVARVPAIALDARASPLAVDAAVGIDPGPRSWTLVFGGDWIHGDLGSFFVL